MIGFFNCVIIKQDAENYYEKMNNMIIAPPIFQEINNAKSYSYPQINSDQLSSELYQNAPNIFSKNQKEEFVLVPTPVDPSDFEKMKQNQNNQILDNNNQYLNNVFHDSGMNPSLSSSAEPNFMQKNSQFIVDQKYAPILENGNFTGLPSLLNQKAFEEVANDISPDNYNQKVENLINLQEKDYENYFSALNNLEYQKVFNSLNKDQESKVYKDMNNADSNLDYNSVISKLNANKNSTYNFGDNITELTIDLPQNKKEIEDSYSKIFDQINQRNSISFVQKNKEITLEDGRAPIYGNVDSKVREFKPNVIGNAESNSTHPNDYLQEEFLSEKIKSEKITKEMDSRAKKDYPRFRSVLPHEITDKQEKDFKEYAKKQKFEEMKNKIEGPSFIQLILHSANKEVLGKAFENIISKINQSQKELIKSNLHNCLSNCDNTCKRVFNLKKEEPEKICKLKCHLACDENSLNKLLK